MRTTLRHAATTAAAVTVAVGAAFAPAAAGAAVMDAGSGGGRTVLHAELAGSLPTDPALFGVTAGGAPWVVDQGDVRLRSGRLDVRVTGLIIPTTGVNPVTDLAASVVCNGVVVATTAAVPFSSAGDARIDAAVTLPERCLAPVVLLNPRGNPAVYIAATGVEG
jgi:hypothetical protein